MQRRRFLALDRGRPPLVGDGRLCLDGPKQALGIDAASVAPTGLLAILGHGL
jgi:hypothetical protein